MKFKAKRFSGKRVEYDFSFMRNTFRSLANAKNFFGGSSSSITPLKRSNENYEKIRYLSNASCGPCSKCTCIRPDLVAGNCFDSNQFCFQNFPESSGDSFQSSMAGTLTVVRALGLFPVHGVGNGRCELRHRPREALSIISAFSTIPVLWIFITAVVYAVKSIVSAKSHESVSIVNKMAGAIFYANAWVSAMILRHVARGWPELQARWRSEEMRVNLHPAPPLRLKVTVVALIVLIFGILEHTLSVLNKTSKCQDAIRAGNSTFQSCLFEYSMESHGFVFTLVNYNVALGLLVVLTSEIATFTWNFQDLFLIQLSIGLITRFKHINSIVSRMDIKTTRPAEWKYARELFCGGLELGRKTAALLGLLVLLSFANNLFFICLQMFNGIGPGNNGLMHDLYFFYSFGFMVGRVTCVALVAASLPIETRKVLPALRCCPTAAYCHEVHRLSQQLVYDEITFSGMGFFSVNRNFMLGVAGAIATYEVVLLQFV